MFRILKQGSNYLVVEADTRRIRFSSTSAIEATRYKVEAEHKARIDEQLQRNIPVREWSRRSGG